MSDLLVGARLAQRHAQLTDALLEATAYERTNPGAAKAEPNASSIKAVLNVIESDADYQAHIAAQAAKAAAVKEAKAEEQSAIHALRQEVAALRDELAELKGE